MINLAKNQSNTFDSSDKDTILTLIIEWSEEIEQQTDLLNTVCKAYVDISSEYIITQANSANLLILLESNGQQSSYLSQLSLNATLISSRVSQLAQDQQNQYNIRMNTRHQQYQEFLAHIFDEKLTFSVG